ncbi:MAG TPA: outer membrane lipoprotein chaperone LolA [Ramlibacter sp.]|nr:outer membrane lipoprotein chaperone LolA [Ramlibacter sp.]
MKKSIATLLMAACALSAQASGLDSLESFVKSARSGRAEFTQVVTGPAKEGQAARSKTSTGTFEFARPNRFRFDYKKPFEQVIVADGQTLWLFDVDLNQVTARQQSQVLASTPAALIAAAPDVGALRKDFNLEAAGEKDGLQWVQATPKVKDGQLHSVKVGFRGNELAKLEILDSFGQRSVLTFTKMELNVAVSPERLQFKPPQGADVVRQ